MTLRIPRLGLIALGVVLVAGAGVAAYLTLIKSDEEVCVSQDTGNEIDCDDSDAVSQAEYDQQQAEEQRERLAVQREADECEAQLGDLLASVKELDSRLAVGLPNAEYSREVGNIRVAYDQVPFNDLAPDCTFDVGIHLENALNSYVKAGNIWNDCITNIDCEQDSIDPELQQHWLDAEGKVQSAEAGLRGLAKP